MFVIFFSCVKLNFIFIFTELISVSTVSTIYVIFQVNLERKTREAEMLTARLVEESERRASEANKLKEELIRAREAEKQAKEKLLEFLSRNAFTGSNNKVGSISSVSFQLVFFDCISLYLS